LSVERERAARRRLHAVVRRRFHSGTLLVERKSEHRLYLGFRGLPLELVTVSSACQVRSELHNRLGEATHGPANGFNREGGPLPRRDRINQPVRTEGQDNVVNMGNASRLAHDEINDNQSTLDPPPRALGHCRLRITFAQPLELPQGHPPEVVPVNEDDACPDAHLG